MANANFVQTDIKRVSAMRITTTGALLVKEKGDPVPHQFYARADFMSLTTDSLKRMKEVTMTLEEENPESEKLREKFKAAIEKTIKEREELKNPPLLDVKEEDVWS